MFKIKGKSLFVFFIAVAIIFSLVTVAIAKQNQNQVQNSTDTNNATSEEDDEDATSSNGQLNAIAHRSVVANFVQNLLKVASSTEGGIGQQVRVIAQQQNDSDTTTTAAITTINNRGKIKIFLIGSDYRNLGALRSEIVHTRNRIAQLTRLIQNATGTSATDTATTTATTTIQVQIQALEQEQTRIENFIKAQEGKFSLFGWLLKLFNK